jgi:hypothetical protein
MQIQLKQGNKEAAYTLAKDTLLRMWKLKGNNQADPKNYLPQTPAIYRQLRDELGKKPDPENESKWGL